MRVSGDKIKRIRLSKGLTTQALGDLMNPPAKRQAVEFWEKQGVVKFETLNRIARALEMAPELLVDSNSGNGE